MSAIWRATALAGLALLTTATVASAQSGAGAKLSQGWYVSVGALFLERSNPDGGTIVAANPAGTPFHTGADFDFNNKFRTGIDVTVGRKVNSQDAIEFRYFEVLGNQADFTFVSPGNFIGYGFTGPGGTNFVTQGRTDLFNYEALVRHQTAMGRLSFLGGLRWLGVNDQVFGKLNGNVATGHYTYDNHLYGGQIGAALALLNPARRLQVNVTGKFGIYGNVAGGGIYEYQGNNFIGSFVNDRFMKSARAAELDISASLRLGDHVTLRAGYEWLWIDGLAMAANAASVALLNPSLLRNPLATTDVLWQGAKVGIDFNF